MREFMTKVSDYISERRNDPEKNGGFVVLCMIGMAIAVGTILCLLLLWRKNADVKQELDAEVYETVPERVLAENPADEELKRQYLMDIEYFGEKIEELSGSVTRIRESLETSAAVQDEENTLLRSQVEEITGGITGLITKLENTENTLYDLNELVKVMDIKTIPAIQGHIGEIRKQMEQVNMDISDIYGKIDALKTTDKELQIKIREMQGALKTSIAQNVEDITNRFAGMNVQIQQLLSQIEENGKQIDDTKQLLGNTQNQVEDTKKQLGDTQNQVDDTKKQLGDTQSQVDDTKKQLGDTQNQVEDTKKQLGDTQSQVDDTKKQLGDTQSQVDDTRKQLGNTQNQVDDTRKQLGDTQNQVDDTKKQLGNTQSQVEDTKKQLGDTQERIDELDTQMLRYRYDETNNTLYLYENR